MGFAENELAVEGVILKQEENERGLTSSVICWFCVVFLKSLFHQFELIFDC